MNDDGMIIPEGMNNYEERTILRGFAKLRKYDRIDLFWGYVKD